MLLMDHVKNTFNATTDFSEVPDFKIVAPEDGYYLVLIHVCVEAFEASAGSATYAQLRKNDEITGFSAIVGKGDGSHLTLTIGLTAILHLKKDDELTVYAKESSGDSGRIHTHRAVSGLGSYMQALNLTKLARGGA